MYIQERSFTKQCKYGNISWHDLYILVLVLCTIVRRTQSKLVLATQNSESINKLKMTVN